MDGENYFFIDREEFEEHIRNNHLIEWEEVYGNLYGTGMSYLQRRMDEGWNMLLEIDVKGGESVKSKLPDSVLIMVIPPSLEQLESRLRGRSTDEEDTIRRRLDNALNEIRQYRKYDYVVVNDRLESSVKRICSIIRAESMKKERVKLIKIIDNK